ncbi:hypothetical protein TNIN_112881 [Trichonephila inaurata madagascariensis]|uniref:Uncharacterized protein n=1 Tax=Trichonephila inaurata madagascariensis TaxID=2747483 RepID=A0A8X7CMU5_9ARAC|nr:hypothetical protein TNIN_112881 [Trichonephila inaurata madagascariensis]
MRGNEVVPRHGRTIIKVGESHLEVTARLKQPIKSRASPDYPVPVHHEEHGSRGKANPVQTNPATKAKPLQHAEPTTVQGQTSDVRSRQEPSRKTSPCLSKRASTEERPVWS